SVPFYWGEKLCFVPPAYRGSPLGGGGSAIGQESAAMCCTAQAPCGLRRHCGPALCFFRHIHRRERACFATLCSILRGHALRLESWSGPPMFQALRQIFARGPAAASAAIPAGLRAYAIGDIHGRRDLFEALIGAIDADDASLPPADTTVILL